MGRGNGIVVSFVSVVYRRETVSVKTFVIVVLIVVVATIMIPT